MQLRRYYASIWPDCNTFLVVLWQDQELFVTSKNWEADKQLRARNNGLVGAESSGTHRMCQDSPQIAHCCELSKTDAQRRGRAWMWARRVACSDARSALCDPHTVWQQDGRTRQRLVALPAHGATVAVQASGLSCSLLFIRPLSFARRGLESSHVEQKSRVEVEEKLRLFPLIFFGFGDNDGEITALPPSCTVLMPHVSPPRCRGCWECAGLCSRGTWGNLQFPADSSTIMSQMTLRFE